MRIFEDRVAGDRVAHGVHRGIPFEVIVGNDIKGRGLFGQSKVFRTLITQSMVDGKNHYACHVIETKLFKSKLNPDRVNEAIDTWRENLDFLLDNDKKYADTKNEGSKKV